MPGELLPIQNAAPSAPLPTTPGIPAPLPATPGTPAPQSPAAPGTTTQSPAALPIAPATFAQLPTTTPSPSRTLRSPVPASLPNAAAGPALLLSPTSADTGGGAAWRLHQQQWELQKDNLNPTLDIPLLALHAPLYSPLYLALFLPPFLLPVLPPALPPALPSYPAAPHTPAHRHPVRLTGQASEDPTPHTPLFPVSPHTTLSPLPIPQIYWLIQATPGVPPSAHPPSMFPELAALAPTSADEGTRGVAGTATTAASAVVASGRATPAATFPPATVPSAAVSSATAPHSAFLGEPSV
ncbi:unnamed protein product [Closterium sp. Naga37s-1]|nr:unnamed protein product [Closterium sp. Naga37s-1]